MQATQVRNNYLLFNSSSHEDEDIQVGNIFLPNLLVKKWISKCKCPTRTIIEQLEELNQSGVSTTVAQGIHGLDLSDAQEYPVLFCKGDLNILKKKSIAVVGTRSPSNDGLCRARKVSSMLIEMGYVVMSGLAKGIDTAAHETALKMNGKTIGVLGTPVNVIYPASNKTLADQMISNGNLIISPSMPYEESGHYLFPRRNRLMAQLSEATVVIEVGSTSGVAHQAAECVRKKKKLIFLKSVAESTHAKWVAGFIKSGAIVVSDASELYEVLRG